MCVRVRHYLMVKPKESLFFLVCFLSSSLRRVNNYMAQKRSVNSRWQASVTLIAQRSAGKKVNVIWSPISPLAVFLSHPTSPHTPFFSAELKARRWGERRNTERQRKGVASTSPPSLISKVIFFSTPPLFSPCADEVLPSHSGNLTVTKWLHPRLSVPRLWEQGV